MAKVKGGLHSDSVGGAFGESMIFRRGKKSTTVTGYYKPGSAKKFDLSYPQLVNRDKYGQIVQAWKALTTVQQGTYNDLAKGSGMSGWNLFMQTYGDSMGFKIALSIDHTKVGFALTDFSTYINLALLPAHFWAHVKNGGGDIRIKTLTGTECPLEVVFCDTALKTGTVFAKLPSVSATVETTFYILYGDSTKNAYGVSETYGTHNVWGSDAKYIGHFQANANDSSANNVTAIVTGATLVTAQIGKGYSFGSANTNKIALDNTGGKIFNNSDLKISFLIKRLGTSGTQYYFAHPETGGAGNRVYFNPNSDSTMRMTLGNGNKSSTNTLTDTASFHHFVALWRRSDYKMKLYVDGVMWFDWTAGTAPASGVQTALFLGNQSGAATQSANAIFDEVRIFNTLNETFVTAQKNNFLSVATFYKSISDYSYAKY